MKKVIRVALGIGGASAVLLAGGLQTAPTASATARSIGVMGSSYQECDAELDVAIDELHARGLTIDYIDDCDYQGGGIWSGSVAGS